MNSDRIKEIQKGTAYPDSVSVQQALLQVWNECEQQPSEGDIDQAIHDICVFEERLTRHYQAAQQPIDEIRKLQQRQRNAIKELLNQKR